MAGISGFLTGIWIIEWQYHARIDALKSEYEIQAKANKQEIRRIEQHDNSLRKLLTELSAHEIE